MFDLVWCQRHQEGWWPGHGKVLEKQNRPKGAGIHGEIPDSQRADCIKMGVWFSSLQRCRILENISEIGFSPIPSADAAPWGLHICIHEQRVLWVAMSD